MTDCLSELTSEVRDHLITSLYTKRAFFWIGSGFSRNFGYPSWAEVIEATRDELGYSDTLDSTNPLRAAEILCAHAATLGKSESDFNDILLSSLTPKSRTEPDWKDLFVELCPDTIVTTNWDQLLEKAFDNLVNIVVRGDPAPQISTRHKNIFKIHGDSGRPNSIVVTQSQYNRFQREDTYLNRKIYTLFSAIFIGYSLSDPNVSFLYDEAFAHIGSQKSPSFMVVHEGTSDEALRTSELLFRQKNIYIIRSDIKSFLLACKDGLQNVAGSITEFRHRMGAFDSRLHQMVSDVASRKRNWLEIRKTLNSRETSLLAVEAISRFFEEPSLYQSYGGSVLSPSNHIDYNEAHSLSQIVINITNEYGGFPSRLYKLIVEHATSGPSIWDFNHADIPFLDLLTVHPSVGSEPYAKRISHIRSVLDWSAPRYARGYCWATWELFEKHMDWIREQEVNDIVGLVESEGALIGGDTKRWLNKFLSNSKTTSATKARISKLLEAAPGSEL